MRRHGFDGKIDESPHQKNTSGTGESFPIFLYRVEALNLFFLDFNLKENPLNQTSKTQTKRVNI